MPTPKTSSYGQNLKLFILFAILCLKYGFSVVCVQQLLKNKKATNIGNRNLDYLWHCSHIYSIYLKYLTCISLQLLRGQQQACLSVRIPDLVELFLICNVVKAHQDFWYPISWGFCLLLMLPCTCNRYPVSKSIH